MVGACIVANSMIMPKFLDRESIYITGNHYKVVLWSILGYRV